MFLALNNRFDSRGLHCARDMLIFLELEHVLDATELHCVQVLPRSLHLHSELAHMFPAELHVLGRC